MADAEECSERSIKNTRKNLHQFGNGLPQSVSAGDEVHITPPMLEALCDHLLEKPGLYCENFIFTIYRNLLSYMSASWMWWESLRWWCYLIKKR